MKYILESQNSASELKDEDIEPITPRVVGRRNRTYPKHLTSLKNRAKGMKPFLVADIETITLNTDKSSDLDESQKSFKEINDEIDLHYPYAAGVMIVRPYVPINDCNVDYYYSSDYPDNRFPTQKERSDMLLSNFIFRMISLIRQNPDIQTVYFHNLSKFDGVFILKHFIVCHKEYKRYEVKPLIRNRQILEIVVYYKKRVLFRFRDSLT